MGYWDIFQAVLTFFGGEVGTVLFVRGNLGDSVLGINLWGIGDCLICQGQFTGDYC